MFGSSKIKRPDTCPVSEESRIRIESLFCFLLESYGRENIENRKVLIPDYSNFPIHYDGTVQTAFDTLKIVSEQMELSQDKINLEFYDNSPKTIATGKHAGTNIFIQEENNKSAPAGLYRGMGENGKYEIALGYCLLRQPENMVAILAHELAHIKLLGENRIQKNDETLTELTTVIFGLGIFNANAAFQTYATNNSYGWQSMGYLSQMEWGYALSLFSFVRNEYTPKWIDHLMLNIKGDFIQGQNFIEANENIIFKNNRN